MKKSVLFKIIAASLAVVAVILSFVLAGAGTTETETVMGYEVSATVSRTLFGFVFGGGAYETMTKTPMGDANVSIDVEGGMSFFALVAFLLVIAGIALVVVDVLTKNKKLGLVGSLLLALGGLAVLLTLVAGTDFTYQLDASTKLSETFKEFNDGLTLGIGAYAWAILCVAGGVCGFLGTKEE